MYNKTALQVALEKLRRDRESCEEERLRLKFIRETVNKVSFAHSSQIRYSPKTR